jgi:hypothetical protein
MTDYHLTTSTRASDADRAAVGERLAGALSDGRLDVFEYEQRLGRAMAATTVADLAPITADLPNTSALKRKEEDERKYFAEWGYWLFGAVVMTGVWSVTSYVQGEWRFYWPVVPLGIWALILVSYLIWDED